MSKTILITGASSGIGKATALLFAEKGWNVIATMRKITDGEDLKTIHNILIVPLDVTQVESVRGAIHRGIEKFGTIDVLLNNAGYAQYGIFESLSDEQIRNQFEVNVFGTMNVTQCILPVFRNQKKGMIVNITSGSGRFSVPLMSLYNASKFALEGFSESLSYELAPQNIVVKIIEPGSTSSNFHHTLKESTVKNSTPDEYAQYIQYLDSKMEVLRRNTSAGHSEPFDIASTIFHAVTDGTKKLRYISGKDIQPIIDKRTSASEEEYMEFMKNLFC
nr:SDR family oxidoreductase [uncultured Chryseobacterium sp.]